MSGHKWPPWMDNVLAHLVSLEHLFETVDYFGT